MDRETERLAIRCGWILEPRTILPAAISGSMMADTGRKHTRQTSSSLRPSSLIPRSSPMRPPPPLLPPLRQRGLSIDPRGRQRRRAQRRRRPERPLPRRADNGDQGNRRDLDRRHDNEDKGGRPCARRGGRQGGVGASRRAPAVGRGALGRRLTPRPTDPPPRPRAARRAPASRPGAERLAPCREQPEL